MISDLFYHTHITVTEIIWFLETFFAINICLSVFVVVKFVVNYNAVALFPANKQKTVAANTEITIVCQGANKINCASKEIDNVAQSKESKIK